MKFVCERCHTRYSIADDKVRQKILKIRCKTCENVITVRDPSAAATAASVSVPQPPPPPARGTPPPLTAAREWFVAVNGDQIGPVTRTEAARKAADVKADDEVYIWKEGLDGWKPPHEVPAIQQELNALRARATAPPASRPPVAPPSRPAIAPSGRAAPHAAARRAPAAASLVEANAFGDEDHTQIQPFDAGMLAADALARAANAPAAVLPFKGRPTNGAPVTASPNLDGLFSDLPPAAGPGAFVPAPASFPAPAHAESGLSKLTGLAGFMSRNPGLKFVAAGAVVVVLLALVVIVLVRMPGDQKPPPPPVVVAPPVETTNPGEAETRRQAAERFQATVATPVTKNVGASIGPRGEKSGRKPGKPVGRPASANQSRPGPLEPPSIADPNAPPQPRTAAAGERVVPAYHSNRPAGGDQPGASASGGPSQSAITAVVNRRENQGTIKTCYDRALKRDEKIRSGRIVATVTIGMSGFPKLVALNAPPEFAGVEPCIKQAIRRWTFPASNEEYQTEFTLIMQGNL